jgi:LysR family hydrogen peroxide-inducible transcriptional activator
MKIQNMRYFMTLCDERHFTRAAKRCGIAQPSLTNAIKRLEDAIGGQLFERTHSSSSVTTPTALALAVKPHFEQALSALERAQTIARQHLADKSPITAEARNWPSPSRHSSF